MSHHTARNSYRRLTERLNRFPQGAPPSRTLRAILGVLVSEREADLLARLPIRPFSARKAARAWEMSPAATCRQLHALASRALLVDIERDDGEIFYALPPPMAGFFEFALMRVRDDIDQHLLSELYYQYLNVEEDFIKELFLGCETRLGRVFVQEPVLTSDQAVHVLDYERASHVIASASHVAAGLCYCRHKMQHLNRACDAPMEICMTFGTVAASLTRHGFARRIETTEALDLLRQAWESNLVQCGENVREGVTFLCNCCGCCCEAMLAARKFGHLHPVHTTGFLPVVDQEKCSGCRRCAKACPIQAISVDRVAKADHSVCLGCGVCARACGRQAIALRRGAERVITPVNSVHRIVLMAIEKGTLPNLFFDQQALASHRAMAAIFSAILKLPPVKRAMANQQVKSRYLEKLASGWRDWGEKVPD